MSGEGGGGFPSDKESGGFDGFVVAEVEAKDENGFGCEDADEEPREDVGGEKVGVLKTKGSKKVGGEKNDGGEDFLAENEAESEVVGFFAGVVGEGGVIENRKNAGRELQKNLDKHS